MGEYATYKGSQIKIGTCEDMYYLRFDQRAKVKAERGSVDPVADAAELRFRFPFPDEDDKEPGSDFNGQFQRGITIRGAVPSDTVEHYSLQFRHDAGYLVSLPCPESPLTTIIARTPTVPTGHTDHVATVHRNGFSGAVQLVAQRWRPSVGLVPVLRCACGAMWRMEGHDEIEALAVQVRSMGDLASGSQRAFYHTIADRILAGLSVTTAEGGAR